MNKTLVYWLILLLSISPFLCADDVGIQSIGRISGGIFSNTSSSGYCDLARGSSGIQARGYSFGGFFQDSDSSGYAYAGYGDYGIRAWGSTAGARFDGLGSSGHGIIGFGEYGFYGSGDYTGGLFIDSDSSGFSRVGHSTYKVEGTGSVSFVQNHPVESDKVIVYAAPEGDEVATYTRGSAALVDGEARISLGETFKWVTNPDIGLTAHLTPQGAGTVLYVASKTTSELVVRSLEGFPADVAFDYIVYGLRIGFEESSTVQEKVEEAYIPSMKDHRVLYDEQPELRRYNALERFVNMRAEMGMRPMPDMKAANALINAIKEFDPRTHELPMSEFEQPTETSAPTQFDPILHIKTNE